MCVTPENVLVSMIPFVLIFFELGGGEKYVEFVET